MKKLLLIVLLLTLIISGCQGEETSQDQNPWLDKIVSFYEDRAAAGGYVEKIERVYTNNDEVEFLYTVETNKVLFPEGSRTGANPVPMLGHRTLLLYQYNPETMMTSNKSYEQIIDFDGELFNKYILSEQDWYRTYTSNIDQVKPELLSYQNLQNTLERLTYVSQVAVEENVTTEDGFEGTKVTLTFDKETMIKDLLDPSDLAIALEDFQSSLPTITEEYYFAEDQLVKIDVSHSFSSYVDLARFSYFTRGEEVPYDFFKPLIYIRFNEQDLPTIDLPTPVSEQEF